MKKTCIYNEDGYTVAKFNHVVIVCIHWPENRVRLNTGGGDFSRNTLAKMNRVLRAFETGVRVFSRDGEWRVKVEKTGEEKQFVDGMEVSMDGEGLTAGGLKTW